MSPSWTEPKTHPDCRPDCVSELRMDQLLHEELSSEESKEAHAMIQACSGCQVRWAERQRGLDAFPDLDTQAMISKIHVGLAEATTPAHDSKQAPNEEGWLSWLFGAKWIGAAAMALIAVVFILPSTEPMPTPTGDVLRSKGTSDVIVFRERAGVVDALVSGAEAQPGDRIQFELRGLPKGFLSVRGQEANGKLYPLLSSKETESSIEARFLVPEAFELDDALGQETLYIYHCRTALDERADLNGAPIDGCVVFVKTLLKVAPQ